MKLLSKTTNKLLVPKLEIADSMSKRLIGLLGREELAADTGLLIYDCNNIHTFFMKFAIDLVFLNDKMEVTKTVARVKPGRLVFSMLKSTHVVELSEGFLDSNPLQLGEQLHVDHSLS